MAVETLENDGWARHLSDWRTLRVQHLNCDVETSAILVIPLVWLILTRLTKYKVDPVNNLIFYAIIIEPAARGAECVMHELLLVKQCRTSQAHLEN
jgi:hypothetical protein